MLATMAQHLRSLLKYMRCDTRKNLHGMNTRSSESISVYRPIDLCSLQFGSCLAHVINLATQVLISTYSKAPHYAPHDPLAHGPDTTQSGDRDEIRLIRSICVKVRLPPLYVICFINSIQKRNIHLPNGRNSTDKYRSMLPSQLLCNFYSI